jgi:hypothetical protein
MSFKPIRTFFQNRIAEIDSDFTEHEDAFSFENIGANQLDKKYHIFYGNVTTTSSNQNTTSDVVSAQVSLFFSGYRTGAEALDSAMDVANEFRINCLRRSKYQNEVFIKNVVCQTIEAIPLNTNDNAIQVRLSFNISVIFGTGINLDCM